MSRLSMLFLAGVVAIGGTSRGAGVPHHWSDTLFGERSYDFGPVPRGGVVRHSFVLTNKLNEPVTILNLRVSCGCTSGTANVSIVQPGQKAIIEAQMDTRNFVGKKSATLYVSLMAGTAESEVGLVVSSTILSDVVLNPGVVDFGQVGRGQTPSQTITIERLGKPDWAIVKLTSSCKAITATIQETQRNGTTVSYQLTVSLKPDASAGVIRDEVRLSTNDPETPSIPVPIGGRVRGELSATPASLSLGNVTSAAGVQGKFVLRASKPFVITKVEGTGDGFTLQDTDLNRKPLHILTMSYNPAEGKVRGDLVKTFRIKTDLPGEAPVEVTATLHIEP